MQSSKATLPPTTPKGQPDSRVYSLNKGDIAAKPSTSVSGQFSISNLQLYVLVDSRSIYSYIASRLSDKLEGNMLKLSMPFITTTLDRKSVV